MAREHQHTAGHHAGHSMSPYKALAVMLGVHFVIMFAVMYTMVDSIDDVVINLNQFYMTVMMVAPTVLTMLLLMPSMYPDKRINFSLYAASLIVFVVFLIFMRTQAVIGDKQFLKSMIPHHSGAILMCERANISDPEINELCHGANGIIESQKREIDQMNKILERL
jgi:predicted neutral ceramidase superfamily lipid hydrolase